MNQKGNAMIYIGKFLYTTNQQAKDETRRRHGEFNLLVSAKDKNAALAIFKERIDEAQTSTEFFEGDSLIYLIHMLELDEWPMRRIKRGETVLMEAFGGGFTWGSALLKY